MNQQESIEIKPYAIYKGNPLYSKADTCRLLQITEKTLRRYVALKLIIPRRVGMDLLAVSFFEKDIDAFMAGRK